MNSSNAALGDGDTTKEGVRRFMTGSRELNLQMKKFGSAPTPKEEEAQSESKQCNNGKTLLKNDVQRQQEDTQAQTVEKSNVRSVGMRDSSSQFIATFAAGVGSGALASIICAPLDLVRTRMQVWGDVMTERKVSASSSSSAPSQLGTISRIRVLMTDILQTEGWTGCFRGLGATLVTVPLFWGVYFPIYEETKSYVTQQPFSRNLPPALIHCGSAVTTGAIADLICNPLFVVRTRLQTQAMHVLSQRSAPMQPSAGISAVSPTPLPRPPGMIETAKGLYQEHGILVFWRGMTANLIGLSHVAVQFPAYEYLKHVARERRRWMIHSSQQSPASSFMNMDMYNKTNSDRSRLLVDDIEVQETPFELLLASGLAKMCASLLTYPHEVLRSRMMDSRSTTAPTLRGTAIQIYQREGIGGFYTGLPVTLIRVIPNCCITFISYELLLRWTKEYLSTSSSASNR